MVEVETEGRAPVARYQRSTVPVDVESACWSGGEQVGKSLLAIESWETVPLFVPGTCYPEKVEVVEEGSLPWSFAGWMRLKKWRGTTVESPSWGRRLLARVVEGGSWILPTEKAASRVWERPGPGAMGEVARGDCRW